MKTLYININNEQIQSNDELEVLKHDLDGDFFFYLGEKVAKGCNVENENALITDFNTSDNKEEYELIIAQWNEIKTILFSEECEGKIEFTLPNGYIHWLKFHPQYVSVYHRNFSHGGSTVITIDLEELYEDSVEDLQRKILRKLQRDDLYKEIDEVVFNDDAVTRKSPIIRAIKDKYEGIGFKSYKKWLEESKEKPQGGGDPTPQICEKCGKNPCECNKNEYYYAVRINRNTRRGTFITLRFYNQAGHPLDNNEYYIVDQGEAYDYRKKTNLLVMRAGKDHTLYYISSNGEFHKIGEYDYVNGHYINNNSKDYYKYAAGIIQNKYILYRNGLNYSLYEICGITAPRLLSQFQSKINFLQSSEGDICIYGDFLTNKEYTINWKTGELINIANNRFCVILGYDNDAPVYLIHPKHWNPEEDDYKNSSVVDCEGNFLWKLKADSYDLLDSNLLCLWDNGKYKVVNLKGDTIIKTDDNIDIINIHGYKCLVFDEKIYIISKGITVDYLGQSVYVVISKSIAQVYSIQTDEHISTFSLKGVYCYNGNDGSGMEGLDIYSDIYIIPFEEWGEQGDIYSISQCKKIYTTIGGERFIGAKNDKFIVEGETYFEIYDNKGTLLKTFEKECENANRPKLYENGYISWLNEKQNYIEYYDRYMNPYYIHINKHFKADAESVEINVLSNRCVIVKAENKELVFVDDVCIAKYNNGGLNQIDEGNYYGYIQDDIEMYCVVNAQRGVIQIPRLENSEFIYLVK